MATRDETMKLEKNEEIGYVAGAGVKLTWDKVNISFHYVSITTYCVYSIVSNNLCTCTFHMQ